MNKRVCDPDSVVGEETHATDEAGNVMASAEKKLLNLFMVVKLFGWIWTKGE